MNQEEVNKVREEIAIIRCDVIEGGWCGKWEELDEAERKPYLDEATQILKTIKGLRIEADDQSLPNYPDAHLFYRVSAQDAYRLAQKDMLAQGWRKVLDK